MPDPPPPPDAAGEALLGLVLGGEVHGVGPAAQGKVGAAQHLLAECHLLVDEVESLIRYHRLLDETGTYVASPADKDGVHNCVEQIQLTNVRASEAPRRRRGASLVSIFVSWICETELIAGLCQLVMRR